VSNREKPILLEMADQIKEKGKKWKLCLFLFNIETDVYLPI
jgi:hypothetical protein